MTAVALSPQKALTASKFALRIEAGCEEMWFAIRDMATRVFTAADLAEHSGASEGRAEFYLSQLVRHGLAVCESGSNPERPVYRVARLPLAPLVVDAKGEPSQDYAWRKVLWTGARSLKAGFTASRLHDFAQEHVHISRQKVMKFMSRLAQAGYLTELEHKTRNGETEYQLRPAMNTGPQPPRFCEATLVYDVNAQAFFGIGLAKEVAL